MKIQRKRIYYLLMVPVFCVAILFFSLRLLGHFNFLGHAEGYSMEPTIKNGDILFENPFNKVPKSGNIVLLKLDLIDTETNEIAYQDATFLKRIKEVNSDDCIWFEGDNTDELSSDSRDLGWFCPGDYEIEGTIMFKD